jgi:hypothetical protein
MLKSKWITAALVAAVALLPAALRGQQKNSPGKPMTLTPLDYVEIRQLASRYGFAVDTGSNNGYDYADLFSADGEFMRPYAKGREQLAALARGGRLGPYNTVHYIMNHVIEPTPDGAIGKEYLIELNWELTGGDQAGRGQNGQRGRGQGGQNGQPPAAQSSARQSAQGQDGRGQGNGGRGASGWDLIGRKAGELARTGGHYEDVYVKTSDGWRFKKRDFIPSKSGADAAPLPPPRVRDAAQQPPATPTPPSPYIPPTKQSMLTAMDYLEIEQLVSSYGHALDSGYGKGENGEAYANLYTADAAFGGAVGHDQLVTLAKIQPRGPDYVRHYLTNHVIEPTPEGAKGKEYLMVIDVGENGKPSSFFLGGHYEETYVKTPEGWRFASRRLFPPRSGPQPEIQSGANAGGSSRAQASATKVSRRPSTLTDADYVNIQQLVARSAYALDTAADKGQAFSRLFTSDGIFRARTGQPYEVKGREQLAAFALGDPAHRGPFYVREYTTNHIVFPSPEGATGRVYLVWIEVGENGNPGVVQSGGRYDDVYVKTAEGWRIKTRTFVPSKLGPRETWEYTPAQ